MKIKHSILLPVFVIAGLKLVAQESAGKTVHLGLVTPISTQGRYARDISPAFALHILQGVNHDNKGASVAGLHTTLYGSNRGVMVSGLVNQVKGSNKGVAVAGLVNTSRNGRGLQLAGLHNQEAGNGFIQVAGLSNYSHYSLLQLAGLVNTSRHAGYQIAGLVNNAQTVKGIQLSGLINIADSSRYPIGILNFIKTGEKQLGLQVYDDVSAGIVLRTGSYKTYGIIGAGLARDKDQNSTVLQMETGLGYRIPLARGLRVNTEAVLLARTDVHNFIRHIESLRTLLGVKVTPAIELTVGPALYLTDQSDSELFSGHYIWKIKKRESVLLVAPGAVAGINIRL
ncbi:hypothetical protein [Niabella drilacis]|uniref:Uncharacterized protein n=1 Tax=Niabella drilacis (strain DSM 25811 / CCM 8410 / CCUG 62505 / LMG 26954 / E90) TaxID=1285928 RepID=A0A1G6V747_NIADE|nr:hypothetical protein [Niabella drilacis]SDD49213.1 hypothetical protein SAMN04487894_109214 [Niabella drilacis]